MEHGVESEPKAIITFQRYILPLLIPGSHFKDVGSFVYKGKVLVSPDGIIVDDKDEILYAIEIKAPTCPDETIKLPVQYSIPDRYACQVLLEGAAVDSKYGTLFLS